MDAIWVRSTGTERFRPPPPSTPLRVMSAVMFSALSANACRYVPRLCTRFRPCVMQSVWDDPDVGFSPPVASRGLLPSPWDATE